MRISKDTVKEYLLMALGCFLFSAGAVMLVEPYGFAPGGTYGIGMVFHHLFGWQTEMVALCIDVPLLIIGTFVLGSKFGLKTLVGTLLLPIFMWLVHAFYGYDSIIEPGVSGLANFHEHTLAAIFGGVIYGVGLGLVYKARATTGGSDVLAMILRKYTHMSMGMCLLLVDGLITLSTLVAFGDWRLPMYSWIIIFITSKMTDMILEGPESKTLFIISDKIEPIRDFIINDMGRGATLLPGTGMYSGSRRDVIYVVVTRKEMITLRHKVAEIDPRAFVNVVDSSEILGEGFGPLVEKD